MAKVTAPLLSLSAKGMVGKKLVFQKRPSGHAVFFNKGHADNPSEASLTQRAWFLEAKNAWNVLSDEDKQGYTDRAKLLPDKPMTGYNLYISEYPTSAPIPTYQWDEQQPAGDTEKSWNGVAVSNDGKYAMAGVHNGRLYMMIDGVWQEERPKGDNDGRWYALAISDDGKRAIAGDYDNLVYTYNEGVWTPHTLGTQYRDRWVSADITPDGSKAVIVPGYGRTWVYDWNSWSEIRINGDVPQLIDRVSINDDGDHYAMHLQDGHVWEYVNGGGVELMPDGIETNGYLSAVISQDGNTISALKWDKYLHIRNNDIWTHNYIADSDELFSSVLRNANGGEKVLVPYGFEALYLFDGGDVSEINPDGIYPSEATNFDASLDCEIILMISSSSRLYLRHEA